MRYLQIVAWMLIAAVTGAILWPIAYPILLQDEEEISFIQTGGAFSMTDQNGRAVTEKDFDGKAKAIFFG